MANLFGFDARNVEPVPKFDPIPAGKYLAVITQSEMKQNSKKTGTCLALTFQILDGAHKGRLLWAWLNLDNPKPQTVQFAKAELAAICRAVGVMAPRDSAELHNLPLIIDVRCKKRPDNGELTNAIAEYFPKDAPPPAPPLASSNGATTPPWARPPLSAQDL